MGKSWREPWEKMRIPIPKPGRPIPTEKDYNRQRDQRVIIPEEEEEYDD